jgi:hypothetical protein
LLLAIVVVGGVPVAITVILSIKQQSGAFADPKFLARYGLLYENYRVNSYFWEAVTLARRVVTICFLQLLSSTRALSFMWVAVVNTLFLLLHILVSPYRTAEENFVRRRSVPPFVLAGPIDSRLLPCAVLCCAVSCRWRLCLCQCCCWPRSC